MLEIRLIGNPIPKIRKRSRAYWSKKAKRQYERTRIAMAEQYTHYPIAVPIAVKMFFFMVRPKSHCGTGRNAGKLKESAPMIHCVKPDVSNLVKFYEDCANGIIWLDDSQIWRIQGAKIYCKPEEIPQTVIQIEGGKPWPQVYPSKAT